MILLSWFPLIIFFCYLGDNCDTSCGINAEEVNGHCRCPDGYTGNPKIECTG